MNKRMTCLAVIATLWSISAFSEPLYSNSRYDFSCCSTVSDFDRPLQIADGFLVQGGGSYTITSVYWTGQYIQDLAPPVDDFTIRLFNGDSVRPSAEPFVSFHIGNSAARTNWGAQNYSYLANIDAITLNTGSQYYISVIANTAGSATDWSWYAEDFPQGASRFDRTSDGQEWQGNGLRNYIFTLFGNVNETIVVPEPPALGLFFLGLITMLLTNRKNRQYITKT